MKTTILRSLVVAVATLGLMAPAATAQDYQSSDNVELIGRLKEAGDGVGARIVGNFMYVTSTTHLLIYDLTNAEDPALVGSFTLDIEFENEDVPTNGKILGISASLFGVNCDTPGDQALSGCLNLYDVTNPDSPTKIASVTEAGNHTQECLLDCTWFWGSEGAIVDARNPAEAKVVGNWIEEVEALGFDITNSPHDVTEVAPGFVVTSSQPVFLLSVRPEEGGSPTKPMVLALGNNEDNRFIHSVEWPRKGRDKFLLVGGETVLNGDQCTDESAAFMTWDASKVVNPNGGYNLNSTWNLIDEVRMRNGTYSDGYYPYNVFGCSVHWFKEHPTFKDGGLVAVSAYEHGTRLYQVTPDGKIVEQGYALPAAGAASAPHWHPNGKVFYTIDYQRGIDVWRYTGDTYVPNDSGQVVGDPNAKPGTGGSATPTAAPCANAAGFRDARATGQGRGVFFNVTKREDRPFNVDVFQQSQGRKVLGNRLVARFRTKTASFTWNGKDIKKRTLKNGNYFVRFAMKTASGQTDFRRVTLTRRGGKFRTAANFYQRIDCGTFKSLKLTSSVFGGTGNKKLGIAYRLNLPAKAVQIRVKVGKKTVKTIKGSGKHRKTFRYSVPAGIARKGKIVRVLVTAQRSGQKFPTVTLTAKRL